MEDNTPRAPDNDRLTTGRIRDADDGAGGHGRVFWQFSANGKSDGYLCYLWENHPAIRRQM
jgi:hypothetical protein